MLSCVVSYLFAEEDESTESDEYSASEGSEDDFAEPLKRNHPRSKVQLIVDNAEDAYFARRRRRRLWAKVRSAVFFGAFRIRWPGEGRPEEDDEGGIAASPASSTAASQPEEPPSKSAPPSPRRKDKEAAATAASAPGKGGKQQAPSTKAVAFESRLASAASGLSPKQEAAAQAEAGKLVAARLKEAAAAQATGGGEAESRSLREGDACGSWLKVYVYEFPDTLPWKKTKRETKRPSLAWRPNCRAPLAKPRRSEDLAGCLS